MSPQLEDIVRKVRSDERIAPAEALVLWHEAPLSVSYTHLTLPTTPYV